MICFIYFLVRATSFLKWYCEARMGRKEILDILEHFSDKYAPGCLKIIYVWQKLWNLLRKWNYWFFVVKLLIFCRHLFVLYFQSDIVRPVWAAKYFWTNRNIFQIIVHLFAKNYVCQSKIVGLIKKKAFCNFLRNPWIFP